MRSTPLFLSVIMTDVNSIQTIIFENINVVCGSHITKRMRMRMRKTDAPHATVIPKTTCQLDL